MREDLAQLPRKRRLLDIRQLQPGQLRDLLNFLLRYLHAMVPLVCLVCFVYLVQPKERDKPDKPSLTTLP